MMCKMKSEVFSYKMQPYLIKACKCDGVTIKNTNLDQSYQLYKSKCTYY
jgi:hypothetical protein